MSNERELQRRTKLPQCHQFTQSILIGNHCMLHQLLDNTLLFAKTCSRQWLLRTLHREVQTSRRPHRLQITLLRLYRLPLQMCSLQPSRKLPRSVARTCGDEFGHKQLEIKVGHSMKGAATVAGSILSHQLCICCATSWYRFRFTPSYLTGNCLYCNSSFTRSQIGRPRKTT